MRNETTTTMLLLLAMACGSSDDDANDDGVDIPVPPTLGAQIDRLARSAVNSRLNHSFDADAAARGAAKDAYNAAAPATWPSFRGEIAKNLALLDSLDGVCGNQLLAGATATAGRYDALADVLANDQLNVNTATGTCTQYLAVEQGVTGDCGGRAPTYDTVDVTLAAAVGGAASGVTDGIGADDQAPSSTTFPFLAD
jgi:Domain of unknown function (DUF4331)